MHESIVRWKQFASKSTHPAAAAFRAMLLHKAALSCAALHVTAIAGACKFRWAVTILEPNGSERASASEINK